MIQREWLLRGFSVGHLLAVYDVDAVRQRLANGHGQTLHVVDAGRRSFGEGEWGDGRGVLGLGCHYEIVKADDGAVCAESGTPCDGARSSLRWSTLFPLYGLRLSKVVACLFRHSNVKWC